MLKLDRAIDAIGDVPARWPAYLHNTRKFVLRRFPFTVADRIDPERVLVVAIAHQKRRPGYWARRQ
jgi:hypothetical protein